MHVRGKFGCVLTIVSWTRKQLRMRCIPTSVAWWSPRYTCWLYHFFPHTYPRVLPVPPRLYSSWFYMCPLAVVCCGFWDPKDDKQQLHLSIQQGCSLGVSWLFDCPPCSFSLSCISCNWIRIINWEKRGQLFLSHFLTHLQLLLSTVSHVWRSVTSQQSC